MDMLFRNIAQSELTQILEKSQHVSSIPHLISPAFPQAYREIAQKTGLWEKIGKHGNSQEPITVFPRSVYRLFNRVGSRTESDYLQHLRLQKLQWSALAVWLGHPVADIDRVQDWLWAFCDDWTWIGTAHERHHGLNDLFSTETARILAEVIVILKDRLEEEVVQRVKKEIEKRIFSTAWSALSYEFWHTCRMNWNHVCNGNLVQTALLLVDDPSQLAWMIHGPVNNMTYALDGFTDDGGCCEGVGYWTYGFGHFVMTAFALYNRTQGEINLMLHHPKIRKICEYPLSAYFTSYLRTCYGDTIQGHIPYYLVAMINRFFHLPELYTFCPSNEDGYLLPTSWYDLALYPDSLQKRPSFKSQETWLPDLKEAILRTAIHDELSLSIGIKAGHNGVPHNHNDLGSIMVCYQGIPFITDPGSPVYTNKTFSNERYNDPLCNSWGHSVPIINHTGQKEGTNFFATLQCCGLNHPDGPSVAEVDLTHAYPLSILEQLVRSVRVYRKENKIELTDRFHFSQVPDHLEEVFISLYFPQIDAHTNTVILKKGKFGLKLCALTEGTFSVEFVQARLRDSSYGNQEDLENSGFFRILFSPAFRMPQQEIQFIFLPFSEN